MIDQIGKTISHYKILELVGQGGMGVVYKAEDTKLKRIVALKFLSSCSLDDEEEKIRFVHEAQAAASLDHPNICTVYEIEETKDKTFISMAFIDGQSLKEKTNNGPLNIDEALDITIQIAEGLQTAHEKGITHRDIKPQNIMITSNGMAKIMDFGVAKLRGKPTLTKAGSRIGTLDYAAPEMVMGSKSDHRSDVFSLGVVLYELITGQRPFQGDHDAAVVYAIVNEAPKSLLDFRKDVPSVLVRPAMKMLEKKKENRYQSIDEVLFELKELKKNLSTSQGFPVIEKDTEKSKQQMPVSGSLRKKLTLKDRMIRLKKQSYIFFSILVLLILIVWIGLQLITGSSKRIESIAVLPLENLSGDPEQEYFVIGMTDALITNLAKFSALKVISKTSVMNYQGTDKSLPKIAQELKVDAIIEGSVMRAGDDVRITVQLIEGETDNHLLAESYERKLSNILKLQDEVAHAIVEQIKLKLTPQEQVRLTGSHTVNPQAYQAYLKGIYFFDKHSETGFWKSIKYYKTAIDLDSTFANAYAGLAMAYIGLGSPGLEVIHPREIIQKAKPATMKALELDILSSEAHTMLGLLKLFYEWDWTGAEKELKRGIELNPNFAMGYMFYSLYLTIVGDHEGAIAANKRALELDPLSVGMNVTLGNQFFEARQFDQAIKQLLNALEMNPNNWHAHWGLGLAYTQKEMYDEAIEEYEKAISLSMRNPFVLSSLGHVFALAGRRADAKKNLDEIIQISEQRYVAPFAVAQIYTGLGDMDQAIEWLERGIQDRSNSVIWIGQNPIFDSLRSDSRFIDLLKKMELDKYNVDIAIPK